MKQVLVSKSELSRWCGLARETVARRIEAANLKQAGERKGNAVYALRDAIRAMRCETIDSTPIAPNDLSPADRNAWYSSELRRQAAEARAAQLLPADEFAKGMVDNLQLLVRFLDELGPALERDMRLTPEQVEAMRGKIAAARQGFVDRLGLLSA